MKSNTSSKFFSYFENKFFGPLITEAYSTI